MKFLKHFSSSVLRREAAEENGEKYDDSRCKLSNAECREIFNIIDRRFHYQQNFFINHV